MKVALFVLLLVFTNISFAKDCALTKPFKVIGTQKVHITAERLYWTVAGQSQEEICREDLTFYTYDVRGREDEAYYCLKPKESEVLTCKTTLAGERAELTVVPASWVRKWKPKDVREHRFHSYVVKVKNSDFYFDIFSRNLSFKTSDNNLILEGAIRTGPGNRSDGYFIRAEFIQ